MNPMKILSEKPLNVYEVKTILEELKEKDKELNFRAEKTHDYLQQITELDKKKAKELFDKLMKLGVSRLKELHVQQLVTLLPKKEDEIKMILQGYSITLTKDAVEQIVSTINDFFGKK